MTGYEKILHFWFEDLKPEDHFRKNPTLDQKLRVRYEDLVQQARRGELFLWRKTAEGRLAEIILLDQFSRNIYRDQAEAFAADPIALVLAQEAVAGEWDQRVEMRKRAFFYMPYMHSESRAIHQEAVKLFSQPGLENSLKYERIHKNIIDLFGRFPHRNKILGRTSTAEEIEFLKQPGSSF